MSFSARNRMTRHTVISGLTIFICALGGLTLALPGSAHTTPATVLASNITLGVDVDTAGNTASALGTIESCKRVEVNNSFDIDLYITDVSGMRGWEYYLGFDPTKIHVISQEFLMVTGFPAPDPVPDSHSPHFLAVGATTQVSGSGVLARLTFQADAGGVSNIAIAHNPLWPRVSGNDPIGDTTGDGYFDGPLIAGSVAVGQDCSGGPIITDVPGPTVPAHPTVTAEPTPVPTPTPAPPMRGDSDCNGQIQLPDVIATLNGASSVGNSGPCSQRGDANCNGGLDANDALRELRFISQSPIAPPAGCQPVGDPIPSLLSLSRAFAGHLSR